jgi:hypothetical protein
MRVGPEDDDLLSALALVLDLLEHLDPHAGVADLGQPGERGGVGRLEHRSDPDLVREAVGVDRGLGEVADDVERRGAGHLDRVEDLAAYPLDQRGHGHHRGHTDDHAENGQARPELVGPDGIQGDGDALAEVLDDHPVTRPGAL